MTGTVLVTGATGFVGSALVGRLCRVGSRSVNAAARRTGLRMPEGAEPVHVPDSGPDADWTAALSGVSVVVHTAARVHSMTDGPEALAECRRINVLGTLNLARQAAAAGVRRFVFISSIKVNGDTTPCEAPFQATDTPAPAGSYAISKREAEDGLTELAAQRGIETVIIRPPLVYGPGVKANFLRMMSWVYRGIPIPCGAIRNKRSLVSLANLIDLVVTSIDHPAAANRTFLVADGEDLSTPELLRRVGIALGRPARLVAVPEKLLETGARMLGKRDLAQRLCASLQVDIAPTRLLLGWKPPASVQEGLLATAADFVNGLARR